MLAAAAVQAEAEEEGASPGAASSGGNEAPAAAQKARASPIEDGGEAREEARAVARIQEVRQPTPAMIEEHNTNHLPYRSWCPFCVAGRRDSPAHVKHGSERPEGHEVGLDYCFVRRNGERQ